MNDDIIPALEYLIMNMAEDHKIAVARSLQEPNPHQYNLIHYVDSMLSQKPDMMDKLFINEKCKQIPGEVLAKTIKDYLLHGLQTSDDLRTRFLEIKEWYNAHGIQWPENRLLGWSYPEETVKE